MKSFYSMFLTLVLLPLPAVVAEDGFNPDPVAVKDLILRYHAIDEPFLAQRLALDFEFHDLGLNQKLDRQGFLAMLPSLETDYKDRAMDIAWVGVLPGYAEVRGKWKGFYKPSNQQFNMSFAIELTFDHDGNIVKWVDDFRQGGMYKPVRAAGSLKTAHFNLVFDPNAFDRQAAFKLGETAEAYYEKTVKFLDRSMPAGQILELNISEVHEWPYASDPGPHAFILIPLKSASRDYGFSMVHEFTHNLMGLSKLMKKTAGPRGGGNRLFDEGFAVVVEEKLTKSPDVFPNFGTETHSAYRQLRAQMNAPIWPLLEAEKHRQSDRNSSRLAYLEQGSFCKFLVDTHGLDKFKLIFEKGTEAAAEIYNMNFEALEAQWRIFIESATE